MASTHTFYGGADYGLNKKDDEFLGMSYKMPAGDIGLATDPRTANQIQAVTNQLNTGAKTIEVQMTMPEIAESIPNQHLDELNKLRKLIGTDLTVHGPLVEPTGFSRQGWEDSQRQQAEKQMWSALQRAKKVNPQGEVVVTFHSSNGLPEPYTQVIDEEGKEKITGIYVDDEREGQISPIFPKENYLTGEKPDAMLELNNKNEEIWAKGLSHTSFVAEQGGRVINTLLNGDKDEEELPAELSNIKIKDLYNMSKTDEGKLLYDNLSSDAKKKYSDIVNKINYGEVYVREGYGDLQKQFNQAWEALNRNPKENTGDIKKLKQFQEEIQTKIGDKDIRDPQVLATLSEEVARGVNLLNTIKTPKLIRPLKDFAVDKASETFSNLAIRSYEEFEKKGRSSPIISIENPPTGMGLNRAEDLRDLIKVSREKFVEKATKEFGLSESEAKEQAEKTIGATWDLGHINMLRKYGFEDKHLIQETETIKPYLKHVHLSDNFGMEHTELPMGMGNVPAKKHLEIIDEYNKKIKKIVETGQWYQHFKTPPFGETLAAMGSPIYSMQMGQTWNQAYGRMMGQSGSYFAGYGLNPDIHHSMYGTGFAGLPLELGGQIGGGRSRLSGTPNE